MVKAGEKCTRNSKMSVGNRFDPPSAQVYLQHHPSPRARAHKSHYELRAQTKNR